MGLNRTALLVCFTWLLKPMIDLNLTRRLLLLQVEQIYKMTTFFAQNGHRYHFQLKELLYIKHVIQQPSEANLHRCRPLY